MAAPFVEGGQEVLDPFFFGPEISVQDPHVGDRTLALLSDQLIERGIRIEIVPGSFQDSFMCAFPSFQYSTKGALAF